MSAQDLLAAEPPPLAMFTSRSDIESAPGWMPTRAFGRGILFGGVLLLAAVFTRRVDLIVLSAPVAFGVALALWRRPRGTPAARLDAGAGSLGEGDRLAVALEIGNGEPMRYDIVVVRVGAVPWLRLAADSHPYVLPVPAHASVAVDLPGQALRWGRHRLGPVVAHAVAADGLLVSQAGVAAPVGVKVYPIVEPFAADDAMPRSAGLIGFHRSRRPGVGGELAGVRVFGPGDRLRRIDWRVSLRARQLHVAATLSERDAEVVVLLDLLHEAGQSGGVRGRRSVLDLTVRAAGGLADHYTRLGDRVSFIEYGGFSRRLRAASGRRHFMASLEWLLDVRVRGIETPPAIFRAATIPPTALVVVLTPLIDARSAALLASLARAGRFVVAIDTLPEELLEALNRPDSGGWITGNEFTPIAARLWRIERANTVDALREHGVPVVTWTGAGSMDEVLWQIARLAGAPRVSYR